MGFRIEALLVEDNCLDAQLVETIVGLADFAQPPNLLHVERFGLAVNMLKTNPFDVVLLDLHLPDGDGPSMIKRLKAVAPNIPIVVMAGLADQDMEARVLNEGADDYLVKSNTFSLQRMEEMDGTDIGNALLQRLHRVIDQAKLVDNHEIQELPEIPCLQPSKKEPFEEELSEEEFSVDGLDASSLAKGQSEVLSHTEHFVQTTLYSVGITLMSTLGLIHLDAGRYSQAEPLLQGALESRKKLLGPNHPDVIVSLHNLATLYDNQGRYLEAECLFYDALKLCEDVFGSDSVVTRKFRYHALVISRVNQSLE